MKLNFLKTSTLIFSSALLISCGGQSGETSADNQEDFWGGYEYAESNYDDAMAADEIAKLKQALVAAGLQN